MRVLICGDRNWGDYPLVFATLANLHAVTPVEVVIEGEARGADIMGRDAAEALDIPVLKFAADWDRFGKAAGPRRNVQMLDEGKPDLVLAFHNDLSKSKGTKHMVTIARQRGIEVRVYHQGMIA